MEIDDGKMDSGTEIAKQMFRCHDTSKYKQAILPQ